MIKKSNLSIKKGCVVISLNPKVYPLEAVYSAAYVFLDRAYILLDGDPKKEIFVELKPKNKEDLEKLGWDFNNELINYADYEARAKKTRKIREVLLQRALITNCPSGLANSKVDDKEFEELMKDLDEDYLGNPDGMVASRGEECGKKPKRRKKGKSKIK